MYENRSFAPFPLREGGGGVGLVPDPPSQRKATPVKIGYGNYGMPALSPWEALPGLAAMGYESVELCADARWPTAPERLSAADRSRLRELLAELGLELSGLMLFINMLSEPGAAREREEALLRAACALGRDLAPGTAPVVISTLGHAAGEWETLFPRVAAGVARFGEVAASEGCRLAVEPHAGGLLDRPSRVLALMERVRAPSLGINFDNSHFAAGGYDPAEAIRLLAPLALHTHVKDGRTVQTPEGPRVEYLLPGDGGCDYAAYFRDMAAAGWTGPVTVEVSVQLSRRPEYDPWAAARASLETLRSARAEALGAGG